MHTIHPKADEWGKPVAITAPTSPSSLDAWRDPQQIATVIPGGALPPQLNGIGFTPWRDAPHDDAGWTALAGLDEDFEEPLFEAAPGKRVAAGVVVLEDDGRVWVVHPSNAFGGYPATFPKGTVDTGVGLRAAAIREAWEESGLRVALSGFLLDVTRSRSRTRYYLGRRLGGCPSDMGWESQAVSLVPRALLAKVLVNPNDAPLVALLG
ncbi:NUDIX hydrolase [Massilia sp. 9I]|uniref:NUDIX hydrolase n=1 Tax=Massilia sp. 9I TaxID=2653152 RepID=UPI0012F027F8|nr:NUDIX hydrolase [Massilia sp. 9I]VXC03561.1 Type III effector HopAG1 [Massilia sp. 9I]